MLKVFPKKTMESMPAVASKPVRLRYSDPGPPKSLGPLKKNWEVVPSLTEAGSPTPYSVSPELALAVAKLKIFGVETVGPAAWAKEARKQKPVAAIAVRRVTVRI